MNYIIYPTNDKIKVPARGYFTKGDKGTSILIISSFLASNFMGYEAKTNVKVEATSATSVKVSWDEAENAKRYYIYSADTLVAKTSYTYYNIVGLTPDTEYCYTITAVNGEVESDESAEACGKTDPDGIAELASLLNVYPNPVNDRLYIETETEVEEIVVYDVYGRQQSTVNGQQTDIDVASLNGGIYFVKVVTENGEIVKRFIKK